MIELNWEYFHCEFFKFSSLKRTRDMIETRSRSRNLPLPVVVVVIVGYTPCKLRSKRRKEKWKKRYNFFYVKFKIYFYSTLLRFKKLKREARKNSVWSFMSSLFSHFPASWVVSFLWSQKKRMKQIEMIMGNLKFQTYHVFHIIVSVKVCFQGIPTWFPWLFFCNIESNFAVQMMNTYDEEFMFSDKFLSRRTMRNDFSMCFHSNFRISA